MHSRRLLPVILLLSATTTKANDDPIHIIECPGNTNYTRGSSFDANLGALLSSLPAAAVASSGFATNVTGATPDLAFGLAQCRADIGVNASDCRACLDTALRNLKGGCPGQKTALIIYDDKCMLRYSNASFFGVADDKDRRWWNYTCNRPDAQPELFMPQVSTLVNNVTRMAAYETQRMFAAGTVQVTPFVSLYGMAQCTRDLPADGCYRCLSYIVSDSTTEHCYEKHRLRMYHRSCSLRYEVYPFYDTRAVEVVMAPEPGAPLINGSNLTRSGSTGNQPTSPINGGNLTSSGSTGHQSTSPINGSDLTSLGSTGSNKRTVRTALLVSIIPVAITLLVLLFAAFSLSWNRHINEEMGNLESQRYTLSTLRDATDNFSEQNRLGQGAFGLVYKGQLQNGHEIAVKKLSKTSKQGQQEMENEVVLVANLQHKNLVRLLGYCIEKHARLLVYEFLINKSLDKILYDPERQLELSWEQRHKIIYGIGRGLMYLHEDSRLTIVHRDLKPSNILLDLDMNPKISDFGLAKLFNTDPSVANTDHVAGTRGYMAPEYLHDGILSAKSDVFSYGVLVLEVIASRRPHDDLLKFVWKTWSQQDVTRLVDTCLGNKPGKQLEILRCIQIGLLCIQDDPQLRPSMAAVIHMLNSSSITLPEPTEPVFAATGQRPNMATPEPSINEASISHMEPR